jgi:tRNA pseudouridine38-40 synthase
MNKRKKYIFKFYYIGLKKYYGSQRQPDVLTIEDVLIEVLKNRNYIKNIDMSEFEMSSRTDRYVSARGSTFSCFLQKKPIIMELNSFLPKEIGIWAFSEVDKSFSSRYDAKTRHYKYIIKQPLSYLKEKFPFNLNIMKNGCKEFEGTHNFQNFSKRSKESKLLVRTIDEVKLELIDDHILLNFKSQGFLRQQVRRMAQKILELGRGDIDYNKFLELFNPEEFHSYQPASPEGLILWNIKYEPELQYKKDLKAKERMFKYFLKQELKYSLKHQLFKILEQNDFS